AVPCAGGIDSQVNRIFLGSYDALNRDMASMPETITTDFVLCQHRPTVLQERDRSPAQQPSVGLLPQRTIVISLIGAIAPHHSSKMSSLRVLRQRHAKSLRQSSVAA